MSWRRRAPLTVQDGGQVAAAPLNDYCFVCVCVCVKSEQQASRKQGKQAMFVSVYIHYYI